MGIRILVAFEDEYGSYRGVIAAAIKVLRPHVEVATAELEGLQQEVERFDPQLVVCSRPKTAIHSPTIAWIMLSTDEVTHPNEVWLGERRWEATEPAMEMLVSVVDGVEERLDQTKDPTNRREPPDMQGSRARHVDRAVPDHKSMYNEGKVLPQA